MSEWCEGTGGNHVYRYMTSFSEGPCRYFSPGYFCDECGAEGEIPEPDFEAQAEARAEYRHERWDVV